MKRVLLTVIAVCAAGVVALGQAPVPTSYSLKFYTAGSDTVVQTVPLASTQYQCGVLGTAPMPAGRYVATWTDPQNAQNRCQYVDTGNGAFSTRPINTRFDVGLSGCLVLDGAVECGDESARASFMRRQLPGAPGGFQVRPTSATVAGVIGPIGRDWTRPAAKEARIANFSTPFGPVQFHVGTTTGTIYIGDFEVKDGSPYELTIWEAPEP